MLKQKTVYFREEDLPAWEAVENKAKFLHDALVIDKHVKNFTEKKIPIPKNPFKESPVQYKKTNNWGA